MLKKEYEILLGFVKYPWRKFIFKEAKNLSRKKSESYVYNSLKKFVKIGVLKEERAGNVILYHLNLERIKAQSYIGFISEYIAWNQKNIPYKDIENISEKIPISFYTLIITGSYAKNMQKENSDMDIVIIIEDSADSKKVYAQLRLQCELNIPKIHLYVFKKSEVLQMILNNEANYGKEIIKNNFLLFGAENYYKIINEAIENGLNDKKLS